MSTGFGAIAGGAGYKQFALHGKKVFGKIGRKYSYYTGSNISADEGMYLVLAADIPAYLTAASLGRWYLTYSVFFRDA
jgi:hypothetical protein